MTARITLWESYLIETLRSKGMPTTELLTHLKNEDREALISFDDTFNYSELVDIHKNDPARIEQAIETGYQVKFVTQPGVKRLMNLKFGFKEDIDFEIKDEAFVNLRFNDEQLAIFKQMLSPNWQITQKDNGEVNICLVGKL